MRVLVTDAHTKQALAITQSLGRRGIEVSLVDSSPTAPAFASQYCRERLIAPPRSNEDAYIAFLLSVVKRQPYDLLVTCDDLTTWYVSRSRGRLAPHIRIVLPEHEVLETAMYKDRLSQFALRHGIPIAETRFPSNMDEVRTFAGQLREPFVVKGVRSSGARQIRYATHETIEQAVQEILAFGQAYNPRWPILQEYIPGENKTVYVLCDRGKVLALCPFETLRSYPVWGGIPATARVLPNEEMERLARFVAERIGWHGVVGIAFRLDHRDGRFKLLEINVRFGGTTQLAIAAGFDLPALLWRHFVEQRPIGSVRPRAGTIYRSLFPDECLHLLAKPTSLGAALLDSFKPGTHYGFRGLPLRVILRQIRSTWWEVRERLRSRTLHYANGTIPMPELPVISPSRRAPLTARRFMRLLAAHLAMRLGILAVVRWIANQRQDRFAILMYHRVGPGGLSAAVFAKQMAYVAKHYRVMPLDTLVRCRAAGEPLPRARPGDRNRRAGGAMALTFDDGYEDTATIAAPILARLKLPATVFPAVCGVRDREPMWPNVVSAVCHHAPDDELILRLGDEMLRYPLRTVRDRDTASEDLKTRLKRVEARTFSQALDDLKTRCADWKRLAWEEAPLLTEAQLKALRQTGFSVGSHTISHPILSRIPLAQAEIELRESKRWLETCLGEPVSLFCYPNGTAADYTPAVVQLVRDAGFDAACSTHPGWNDGSISQWVLRRFPTSEPSLALFACRLELLLKPRVCFQAVTAGCQAIIRKLPRLIRALGGRLEGKLMDAVRWCCTFRSMLMLERPLAGDISDISATIPVDIRLLTEADISALVRFHPYLTEPLVRKRLIRGDRCLVAVHEGRIVHCSWIAVQGDPYNSYLQRTIRLGPRQAYFYNAYTDPAVRNHKIMQAMRAHTLRLLQAEQYESVVSLVVPSNRASLSALGAGGFRVVARMTYRCRLGRRSWSTAPHTPVVVLGLSVTGLNVLRNFAKRKIPVIGVDCDSTQVGFLTRCAPTHVVSSPDEDPEAVLAHLAALARRWDTRPVLYPTTDRFALFVSRHRTRLAAQFRFHLAPQDLIEAMVDKDRFAQLMEAHGVPTPRTWRLDTKTADEPDGFPCVVKPSVSYRFKSTHDRKGFCVSSPEALEELRATLGPVSNSLVVQELIPGEDDQHYSCAAYLDARGDLRGVFTSRKLRQYPRTLGIGSLCESVWEPDVAALGVRVLQAVGFRGLAEVELKRDARDGTLKVLEINPRSWIQNQLAQRSGVDLDYLAYLDASGLNPPGPPVSIAGAGEPCGRQTDGIKWLAIKWDVRAAGEAIRARELTVGAWWRSLRGTKVIAYGSWTDPAPFARELQQLLLALWNATLRRPSPDNGTGSIKLLTTHPIPESAVWQRRTTLVSPKPLQGLWGLMMRVLRPLGLRDVTLPFRLLHLRNRYDLLITGATREDCLFALLQALPGRRKIPHLMMCCLWKREPNPLRAWVKRTLLWLMSRSVTKFIVWSTEEIHGYAGYFGIDPSHFAFVPHPASLDGYAVAPSAGSYLFAGGDSSRDYRTLLEAVRPLRIPVVIASKNPRWKDHAKALAHVRVETVSPQRFRELMAGARAVVVPLEPNLLQSAGQQTYLNAMCLRKPVIVSDAPGVRDYLCHEQTGWIVPPGDAAALRETIQRVFQDHEGARRIAEAGAAQVMEQFTIERFVERNLELARAHARNGHPW